MQSTMEELIPESEIERVHAHARFGDISKREVVNAGVTEVALRLSVGGTTRAILLDHKLINRSGGYNPTLSAKGRKYFRALVGDRFQDIVDFISRPQPEPKQSTDEKSHAL